MHSSANVAGQGDMDDRFPMTHERVNRAYRLAGLLLGNQDEAEDATQEALVRAWQRRGSVRNAEAWSAWFDRILVNICRDHMRARGRVKFLTSDVDLPARMGSDSFREVLDRDAVLRAVQSLDEECRIVVILHYWDDLTLPMIAARTGWRLGTVKSRLHRALEALRSSRRDG